MWCVTIIRPCPVSKTVNLTRPVSTSVDAGVAWNERQELCSWRMVICGKPFLVLQIMNASSFVDGWLFAHDWFAGNLVRQPDSEKCPRCENLKLQTNQCWWTSGVSCYLLICERLSRSLTYKCQWHIVSRGQESVLGVTRLHFRYNANLRSVIFVGF